MNSFRDLWQWKWLLRPPLRLRVALWSALLTLVIAFGLLFFVNAAASRVFPLTVGSNPLGNKVDANQQLPPPPQLLGSPFINSPLSPIAISLLWELQNVSLFGMALATLLAGIGAYWFAGIALRPVRKVSASVKSISADTLHTRLALDGPPDEVKELADTFDTMLGRLEYTFELQNNFIGDVAHELRTPLTSLRTNLEVVTADENATLEDYHAMAAAQERALTRLECLVADLLILARGEQFPSQDTVALVPLLQEVLGDLEHAARAQQVTLKLVSETEAVVRGDASLLARVFSNLVENGIHCNRAGGMVVVSVNCQSENAVVTVSDNGLGISPEKLAHIFDRFYRVESSRARHTGGAGLGLSIVKTIVQQHSGQVGVQSVLSQGSTFTVRLPLSGQA